MKFSKLKKAIISAGLALSMITSVASATSIKDYPRVAIMNFGNKAITSKGFRDQDFAMATEYAIYQLSASGWFDLIDYEELNTIAQMHNINNSGLVDPSTIVAMGQFAGAEYMIVGNVTGLTAKENIVDLTGGKAKAGVSEHIVNANVAVRIVDIKTGRIMGAGIGKGSSTSTLTEIGFIKEKWTERATSRNVSNNIANVLIDEYSANNRNKNGTSSNSTNDGSHMDYNYGTNASENTNMSYGANQNYNEQYGNQANNNGSANASASSNRNLSDSERSNSNYGDSARQDYDGTNTSDVNVNSKFTDDGKATYKENGKETVEGGGNNIQWTGDVVPDSKIIDKNKDSWWDIKTTDSKVKFDVETYDGERTYVGEKESTDRREQNGEVTGSRVDTNHQTNTQNDSGYSNSSSDRRLTDNSNANANSSYNNNASNSGHASGNANQSENYNSRYNNDSSVRENMNTRNTTNDNNSYNRNSSSSDVNRANNTYTNNSDNTHYTYVKEQEVYGITIGTKQVSEIQVLNAISKAIRDAFYGKMGLLTTLNNGKQLDIKTGF